MTIKEGVMVMQLEPGMRGWSGDKKNKTLELMKKIIFTFYDRKSP